MEWLKVKVVAGKETVTKIIIIIFLANKHEAWRHWDIVIIIIIIIILP